MTDIPRRSRIDLMTPAELAIRAAMIEVKKLDAHPLLTEAVVLLGNAQRKVADYVDRTPAFAWVIERGDSPVHAPTYWAGVDTSRFPAWSQDHMEAIRFSRKVDAERAAANLGTHRVCEHGWG